MSKLNNDAFSIIAVAGDGRAKLNEALKEARKGNYGSAKGCLEDAEKQLLKAHELQTALLKEEAEGSITDTYNVIVAHAQDYVMTAEAMKDIVAEIINLYEKVEN